MIDETYRAQRDERLQQLVIWVNEGYRNALRLYGAAHPLTRSWLKEKHDIEWFTTHEIQSESRSAA